VTAHLPDQPYPSDTRAKGWRFELDMERARQSDTWALAPPEVRPWLLMMWATAWEQTPCGSLPDDDELIAARLGIPPKMFAKLKPLLLRKWWKAADGRLYHDVLVQRVMEMMATRLKESDRKALARARASASVPRDNHGTDVGLPWDSTPRATPEPEPEPEPEPIREEVLSAKHFYAHDGAPLATLDERPEPKSLRPPNVLRGDEVGAGMSREVAITLALAAAGIPRQRMQASHPDLIALVNAGASVSELVAIVPEAMAKKDPFPWLLATAIGRRNDAIARPRKTIASSADPPWRKEQRERMQALAGPAAAKQVPKRKDNFDVIATRID
jgi:hypothetical protein